MLLIDSLSHKIERSEENERFVIMHSDVMFSRTSRDTDP